MDLTNRSKWKNQFYLYENASKFHNKIREIFITDSMFRDVQCYQEVPVKDLVPNYPNRKDAVDWFVDSYNLIIELHGKQHYNFQSFGSKDSYVNQKIAFNNIKFRDNRKKTMLLNSGFSYLEINYKELAKIDSEYLKNKIFYESESL